MTDGVADKTGRLQPGNLMCIMCYVCLLQMADESRKKLFKRQLYDFD